MNDRHRFRAFEKSTGKMAYDIQNDTNFRHWISNKRFIVTQCTGLRDKNDKLIYEGDILNFDGSIYLISDIRCIEQDIFDWYNYIEIIGNIYQNPELMEEEE